MTKNMAEVKAGLSIMILMQTRKALDEATLSDDVRQTTEIRFNLMKEAARNQNLVEVERLGRGIVWSIENDDEY